MTKETSRTKSPPSDAWERGREGGKLHRHSCIPEARCDDGQIENSNTWDFLLQLLHKVKS